MRLVPSSAAKRSGRVCVFVAGDGLDRLDPPSAVDAREVHFRHQPVIAADAETCGLYRAQIMKLPRP